MGLADFFKGLFDKETDPEAETVAALLKLHARFVRDCGTICVQGDLYLSGSGLNAFPDLSSVVVTGSVYAERCGLKSLKGAPQMIGRNFFCDDNDLENLDGAPKKVGLIFDCQKNPRLKDAHGAPAVFGSFVSDFAKYASPAALAEAAQKKLHEDATVLKRTIGAMKPISLKITAST